MSEKCLIDPTMDCLGLKKAEELEHALSEYKKDNEAKHDKFTEWLNRLELRNAVQSEQYGAIMDKLDTLTKKVEALESKPGKRWDSMVTQIIGIVVAALAGFFLAKMGLS